MFGDPWGGCGDQYDKIIQWNDHPITYYSIAVDEADRPQCYFLNAVVVLLTSHTYWGASLII